MWGWGAIIFVGLTVAFSSFFFDTFPKSIYCLLSHDSGSQGRDPSAPWPHQHPRRRKGDRGDVGWGQIRSSQKHAFCLVIIQADTQVVPPAVLGLVLDGEAAAKVTVGRSWFWSWCFQLQCWLLQMPPKQFQLNVMGLTASKGPYTA